MKNFKLFMIAFIAIICMFAMIAISNAQELQDGGQTFAQTITVKDQGAIKAFRRESVDCINWGDWIEWAPVRSDEKGKVFTPREVNQDVTNKIIGIHILKWLSKRPKTSGHYNFSGNKNYDWEKYGGDKYGTWMQDKYWHPVRKV